MGDVPGKLDGALTIGSTLKKISSGNVTVLNETVIEVNKTSGAATTVTLPATPRTGRMVFVKDGKGDAATNQITVAAASGNIDGAANFAIANNFGSALFYYNGTQWNAFIGAASASGMLGASATPGSATSVRSLVHKKTGIADNTATDLLTVTVPNGNHAAAIRLVLVGTLGTGTDTFESTRVALGMVVLARQTGANVVATAVALSNAGIATVSGGATLTLAYAVSAVTGAVGAVNTFTVTVTLVKTGTVNDHQCVVFAELVNAEASGVTVAGA
jgi:hypothetical protein